MSGRSSLYAGTEQEAALREWPVRLRGTEKQHKPCEIRRYAEVLSSARFSPHMAFQGFRLRKTLMRKPIFCGDFCEDGRRHKIAPKHAIKIC